jgi:hypothetical protein
VWIVFQGIEQIADRIRKTPILIPDAQDTVSVSLDRRNAIHRCRGVHLDSFVALVLQHGSGLRNNSYSQPCHRTYLAKGITWQITELQEHGRASGPEIGAHIVAVPSNGQASLGQNLGFVLRTMNY